jgi:hypothetical protein
MMDSKPDDGIITWTYESSLTDLIIVSARFPALYNYMNIDQLC